MSDIVDGVAEIARDVQSDASGACTVILRRYYAWPREELWRACTTPKPLAAWFVPITGHLALGGHYQFEGNAGGEILECDAPRDVRVSWLYADQPAQEVSLHLTTQGAGTMLELRHYNPRPASVTDLPFAVGPGWDSSLVALGAYLGDCLPDGSWWESAEGIELIERSARAWQRALLERALASPEVIEQATEQSIAFYTGADTAQAEA